jgi:hypothetical protein
LPCRKPSPSTARAEHGGDVACDAGLFGDDDGGHREQYAKVSLLQACAPIGIAGSPTKGADLQSGRHADGLQRRRLPLVESTPI